MESEQVWRDIDRIFFEHGIHVDYQVLEKIVNYTLDSIDCAIEDFEYDLEYDVDLDNMCDDCICDTCDVCDNRKKCPVCGGLWDD